MTMLIACALAAIGLLLIVGGARDWGSVTNPPSWMAPFYTQAFLRLFFSRRSMRAVSVILGVLLGVGAVVVAMSV